MSKVPLEKIALKISFSSLEAKGELVRFLAPRTIEALFSALPFTSKTFLYNEEVYFETPVSVGPERPKSSVSPGDIAYWPPGKAFCIFFGKSQPYGPVNIVGKISSDLEPFRKIKSGERVEVRLGNQ
jgi:hypothetical protein